MILQRVHGGAHVRTGAILLKKDFEGGLRAILIQGEHLSCKMDSRSQRPWFNCCATAARRRLFQQHRPRGDMERESGAAGSSTSPAAIIHCGVATVGFIT